MSTRREVRVKARLVNAVDEALACRDMLKPEEISVYQADALIGAGAVRSVLPPYVVERLGLALRDPFCRFQRMGVRSMLLSLCWRMEIPLRNCWRSIRPCKRRIFRLAMNMRLCGAH